MRWSQYFIPTLREDPADAEAVSHKLLLRAGIVRQYILGKYEVPPQNAGFIGLGNEAVDSPDKDRWDGVSLTLFLDREELQLVNSRQVRLKADPTEANQSSPASAGPTH